MEVPGLPGPQVGLPEFALVVGLDPEPRPFQPGEHSSVRAAGGEGLWPRSLCCAQFPTHGGRQRALTDVSVHVS